MGASRLSGGVLAAGSDRTVEVTPVEADISLGLSVLRGSVAAHGNTNTRSGSRTVDIDQVAGNRWLSGRVPGHGTWQWSARGCRAAGLCAHGGHHAHAASWQP